MNTCTAHLVKSSNFSRVSLLRMPLGRISLESLGPLGQLIYNTTQSTQTRASSSYQLQKMVPQTCRTTRPWAVPQSMQLQSIGSNLALLRWRLHSPSNLLQMKHKGCKCMSTQRVSQVNLYIHKASSAWVTSTIAHPLGLRWYIHNNIYHKIIYCNT